MAAEPMEIDDSLYSRQRYVLGDGAMQRMAQSNVFISGFGGLGVEIAKNIVLAGVKSLTVHDTQPATEFDLGTQFFLRPDDVANSRNRAEASVGRLCELNPYVVVKSSTSELSLDSSLEFLNEFQCVVMTEASLPLLLRVNDYCRSRDPPIKFVASDVRGVFCWSFCDFGQDFEVVDSSGEEPHEVFVSDITKGNPGVVTTLENKMHGFQSGDIVTFKEVNGMTALNGKRCPVEVLTPYKFTIGDTSSDGFQPYESGGIVVQVKIPTRVNFNSLESELHRPSLVIPDLAKMTAPGNLHLGILALSQFIERHGAMPRVWNSVDADEVVSLALALNREFKIVEDEDSLDRVCWRHLASTARGSLAPLCAFMGGVVAQEALKGLTGKFSPLAQWLHLDAREVLSDQEPTGDGISFHPRDDRYDALRICVGEDVCRKLAQLRIFMVGCGAIGCEMLKNLAVLGAGQSTSSGQLTITDNDLIEKSNLNRQFLFRPQHIRQPKSTTAAASVLEINPDLMIEAHQHKVCVQTESSAYPDSFFQQVDVVVNALDNLEARRYMDSRCVTNQRPLFESGTMGAKGHVQVIIPFLTESYASQNDPLDEDVPYCTLHSFPAVMDHCIEWARDKFETLFCQKPTLYNKFWSTYTVDQAITKLQDGVSLENVAVVSKITANLPISSECCIAAGRFKFENFFNHRAKQLLHAFPLDTKMTDGSLFWQSPKRPPNPIVFDASNQLHLDFVQAFAHLFADTYGIKWTPGDFSKEKILRVLSKITVPEFQPKSKRIETDVSAKKPELEEVSGDELKVSVNQLQQYISRSNKALPRLNPATFEKDDDSNGHIDFIVATSNLRAVMYNIETADRLKIKRIAGRIVPAIATTTAAVAGLVTVELIKVVKRCTLDKYRNAFINLALPMFVLSEPGPPKTTKLQNDLEFSLWDRWEIQGSDKLTLQGFIEAVKAKYHMDVTMVVLGVKMIYVPIMPGHNKRLPQLMSSLIKASPEKRYVDLVVSYSVDDGEEEMGPPVRYYF